MGNIYHGLICNLLQPFTYVLSCVFPREESCVHNTCFLHASGLVGKGDIKESNMMMTKKKMMITVMMMSMVMMMMMIVMVIE